MLVDGRLRMTVAVTAALPDSGPDLSAAVVI